MGKLEENLVAEGDVLDGRWTIRRKLGGGGFGQVWAASDSNLSKDVAIKTEPRGKKEVLPVEAEVLEALKGRPHSPPFYGVGGNARINFLVMEMLGKNLSELRRECPGDKASFSLRTAFLLALQGLEGLEDMHSKGFLHRDVKPSNYVMGLPGTAHARTVFLIDFGLSRRLFDKSGELKEARPPGGFRGTVKYAAPAAHEGLDLGRKDDLVSLLYMTVEMGTGALPWRRIRDKKEVGLCKKKTSHKDLCQGLGEHLLELATAIFAYEFGTEPDYSRLKELLISSMESVGGTRATALDWEENWVHWQACQNLKNDTSSLVRRQASVVTSTLGTSAGSQFGRTGKTHLSESNAAPAPIPVTPPVPDPVPDQAAPKPSAKNASKNRKG